MWIWWAPLAAVGLHITEEFFWPGGFGDWDRAYRPAIKKSITPRLHVIVNLLLVFLCFSVWLAGSSPDGAVIAGFTLRSAIPPAHALVSWVVLVGLLAGNAIFHVVGSIRTRRYSPGMVTGVLLYLPLAGYGLWHFIRAGRISVLAAAGWLLVGASYQLWATIGHQMRARRAPARG
jgi:hypothetical protein